MSNTTRTTGRIITNKGEMPFELYDDSTPITVANFKKLITSGFYNGLKFHRVIPDFMAQAGCPDGTGAGGPGWTIPCETSAPNQRHDKGILSMAHRGPNTGGSQFFICHNRKNTSHLDGVHTAFGTITSADGFDVLDTIKQGDTIQEIVLD
jgi:cyclophilin family peptidyl-prolyl cis-trans isomerase